jgi:phosphoglycolate phosphatase
MSELLIFDWDGTLCDSLSRIAHCLQLSAADVGLPEPSLAAAKNIVGLGLDEVMNELFPTSDRATKERLRRCYSQHFLREDNTPSAFFPGVREQLETLREQGFTLAVATGKSRKGLDRVLDALGMRDFFHSTRCADETASKPHPAMLFSLLHEFKLAPETALMVGDTSYDMAMARTAGVPRLAVSYGAHSRERLLGYQPIACIDEFEGIHALLSKDEVATLD